MKPAHSPDGRVRACRPRRNGKLPPIRRSSKVTSSSTGITTRMRRRFRRIAGCTRCSAMCGSGLPALTCPFQATSHRPARSVSTTPNSCATKWFCAVVPVRHLNRISAERIAIPFPPTRGGSLWASDSRGTSEERTLRRLRDGARSKADQFENSCHAHRGPAKSSLFSRCVIRHFRYAFRKFGRKGGSGESRPARPSTPGRTENHPWRIVRAGLLFYGTKKRGKIRTRSPAATPGRHTPVVRPGIVERSKCWCTNS